MKQFLVFLFLLCTASVLAQDVIVKKDGSTIVCRIVELTSSEIVYKKWSDLNGSNYVMNRADASTINYQNGKKVNLSEATNLYQPNNQNDGVQQYNDRALLSIDAAVNNPYRKMKTLKAIGWITGGVFAAAGLSFIIFQPEFGFMRHNEATLYGLGLVGIGAACTTTFLVLAKKYDKKEKLLSSAIYQRDFKLPNGSSFSAGIDMLTDRTVGTNNLGIGLRYNF